MLASIRLYDNELTGTIPVEITGMMRLSKIYLRIACFHKCRFMTHMLNIYSMFQWYTEELRLDINQLVGTIPPGIGSLPNLRTYFFLPRPLNIHVLLPFSY